MPSTQEVLSEWRLIPNTAPGQWHGCALERVLQVEWSDSQNRNVDLHIRTEWVGGVCRSGASSGERCQHRRHLSTQTGTTFVFVHFMVPLYPHTACGAFSLFAALFPNLFPFLYPLPPLSLSPFLAPISTCSLITPSPLQGHSRRVQVTVKPVQHSGTLPLMVEAILSVSIGCVTARSTKLQRGLDSYQVRQTGLKLYLMKIG